MTECSPAEELRNLEARIQALLPPRYTGCFEDVSPSSMGSAGLRYDHQGKVVWGEIWTTFCHLALAGGPPHRGRLLNAVAIDEVQAAPQASEEVVAELTRALRLCVELPVVATSPPGWIGLHCKSEATAAWLVRAIFAENVFARHEGAVLYVPAGPHFRVEKELKNVVVCVAKTCHYLFDHLEPEQQPTGASPLLVGPPLPHEISAHRDRYEQAATTLQQSIANSTGLPTRLGEVPGWVGLECGDEEIAVWLLRAIAVDDVLVRREESTLYVPVNLRDDGQLLEAVAAAVARAHHLSLRRGS